MTSWNTCPDRRFENWGWWGKSLFAWFPQTCKIDQPFPGIALLFATLGKGGGWVSRDGGGDGGVLHRNVRADDEVGCQAEPGQDERRPGQLLKARLWGWNVAEAMDGRGFKEFLEYFHRGLCSFRAWYFLCQIVKLEKKKGAHKLTSAEIVFVKETLFNLNSHHLSFTIVMVK